MSPPSSQPVQIRFDPTTLKRLDALKAPTGQEWRWNRSEAIRTAVQAGLRVLELGTLRSSHEQIARAEHVGEAMAQSAWKYREGEGLDLTWHSDLENNFRELDRQMDGILGPEICLAAVWAYDETLDGLRQEAKAPAVREKRAPRTKTTGKARKR